MTPAPERVLTRAEYRAWAMAQPRGRYERMDGRVIKMAAERLSHVRAKMLVWQALAAVIRRAGVRCEAFGDGATVEVGEDTDYEPDALVACGEPADGDAIAPPNPVIVVEILSRSTPSIDTGAKLTDYFRVPSIQHYLILRPDRRIVIHHRRAPDGSIGTGLIREGEIALDPPGIVVPASDLFAPT